MDFSFVDAVDGDFEPEKYLRILIAIAKSDPENGAQEYNYVRKAAARLGLDYQYFLDTTDKSFSIERQVANRVTALSIIRDAVVLASMDRNFSLPEKQRVYTYAEKLDISRSDVDELESIIQAYRKLHHRWLVLVEA